MSGSLFDALSRARISVEVREVIRPGVYLGVPVLVVEDEDNGWLLALWPDRLKPGRSHGKSKPFLYRTGEWWRIWSAQVGASDHEYEPPSLPLTLQPKPEAVDD